MIVLIRKDLYKELLQLKHVNYQKDPHLHRQSPPMLRNLYMRSLRIQTCVQTQLTMIRKNYLNKKVHCKFCEEDVSSRNFVKHLSRHHTHEKELKDVLDLPVKSKERKQALDLLEGSTNFELYLEGTICPKKQRTEDNNMEYYPCIYCKVLYSKRYLYRHAKICPIKQKSTGSNTKSQHIALSQTAVACALDTADVISKLHIKEQVFNMMRDDISFVAKKDLLIAHYGESYLKSQKRERKEYNRMRELARLLITYRTSINDQNVSFKDLLHPEKVDEVLSATRKLAGFDAINKT
ncbi:hypothetical protein JTB14_025935 [Gonioctena quinquepunctata]|nr:hypothetical protein JTB14_025935 [Gonioctena quinquepunctata]